MKHWGLLCGCLVAASVAHAQPHPGVQIEVYPAGQMFMASVTASRSAVIDWNAIAGYNRARRQDFGLKEDERGGGWGGGTEALFFVSRKRRTWFVGPRFEFWILDIAWKDPQSPCGNPPCITPDVRQRGTTRITVLQPTLQLGIRLPLGDRSDVYLSVALGREINVRTRGEEVGQGLIALVGAALRL